MLIAYHKNLWKSELIDFVILQQDAFNEVDQMTPMKRQIEMVELCNRDFGFEHFKEVNPFFKKLINAFKPLNYTAYELINIMNLKRLLSKK